MAGHVAFWGVQVRHLAGFFACVGVFVGRAVGICFVDDSFLFYNQPGACYASGGDHKAEFEDEWISSPELSAHDNFGACDNNSVLDYFLFLSAFYRRRTVECRAKRLKKLNKKIRRKR